MRSTMLAQSEATILLVEDDSAVRLVLTRTLRHDGFSVHECGSGEDAVDFVRDHAGPIDLLLVDTALNGMSGTAAADRIRAMRPGLPVLHMSGYNRDAVFGSETSADENHFIGKPLQRRDLEPLIRAMLGTPASRRPVPVT